MEKLENETLEFKRSSGEAKDAMKSVCGMLNKYGHGTIYFGIDNNGNPIKNTITDSSLRDISRIVFESIEPKISPYITVEQIDGVDIIKLSFHGNDQPYSSKGVYYIRVADENRSMTQKELLALFQSKHYEDDWEKLGSGFSIEDLDDKSLESFYWTATNSNRLEMEKYDKIDLLRVLGLLNEREPNNAGYYLFGKDCNLELKTAVFATSEKITFLDLKSTHGNIYTLVNTAIAYINEHINWEVEIEGIKRNEIPEIPQIALREIIVNSFAHAKYSRNTTIEINIYPDGIEIINPGSFPENYSPIDFINKRVSSMKRNPLILDVLFRSKDVEKTGTGFSRVNNVCKSCNVQWTYEKLDNQFKFIFKRNNVNSIMIKSNTKQYLSIEETKIIKLILENNRIKVDELAYLVNLSSRQVQRIIKSLTEKNILKRIGTKNGYWTVNN